MIGIGVTTRNRNEQLAKTLSFIKKFAPKGSVVVVVDDASETPVKNADFRFETNVGTPTAKNKCIELLNGCEHLFLFDDDCYPVCKEWETPYINSGATHLNFTFEKFVDGSKTGHEIKAIENNIVSYSGSCGCMMYIHKSVIEKIGGFDTSYPKWGGWHHDFSYRAYNAGLIPEPFMDVLGSGGLFHSKDYVMGIGSLTTNEDKAKNLKIAKLKNAETVKTKSVKYCEYREFGKIGIGITTHNRQDAFKKCYENIKKFSPKDAVVVIIDDASDVPVANSTFRFEHNVGISVAKNKCIELLMKAGCEHLFLFDDDCFPKVNNWHLPYINSGEKHLCFTFTEYISGVKNAYQVLSETEKTLEFNYCCGCMLYLHRDCVEKVGGFDVDYHLWGGEHADLTTRIYNAGLTSKRFQDVRKSERLLCSLDQQLNTNSTTPRNTKNMLYKFASEREKKNENSTEFMPYKLGGSGIILACYFTGLPDPQRGEFWKPNVDALMPLIYSCSKLGIEIKIFHDCFEYENDIFVKCYPKKSIPAYLSRWLVYKEWLKENKRDFIFCVDSTDVEVLRYPFNSLNPNYLYIGDEYNNKMSNSWFAERRHFEPLNKIQDYYTVIDSVLNETLLNCGIVGGSYAVLTEFLGLVSEPINRHFEGYMKANDMAVGNYIFWKHFKNRMYHGIKVNTGFKKFEYNNISFFKHK